MDRFKELAQRIRGPLAPLFVPMTTDEKVDYEAMALYVQWLVKNGVDLMWLTRGTSEYMVLDEPELLKLTATIAEAKGSKAVLISSSYIWSTRRCIRYVQLAAEHGADVVKVVVDFRYFNSDFDEDSLYGHYRDIAEATDVPLFAYTDGRPGMSFDLVRRLAAIPQVIGMKNDTDDFHAHRMYCKAGGEHFLPVTGGFLGEFLYGRHFGAKAYADVPILIAPREAVAAYQDHLDGKEEKVVAYIEKYERPLLDVYRRSKTGFRPFFRTVLWLMGHFNSNVGRRPHRALEKEKIQAIRKFLEDRQISVVR